MRVFTGLPQYDLSKVTAAAQAIEAAGYTGPIEVEIFNQQIWDTPGDEVLALMKDRFSSEC